VTVDADTSIAGTAALISSIAGALPPVSGHGVVDYAASCRVAAWRCS
jgi:hypothetical protein